MAIIYLNEKARQWHLTEKTNQFMINFKKGKDSDNAYDPQFSARFGDIIPESWDITIKEYKKEAISKINGDTWVDVYVFGCTHNNDLNPYKAPLTAKSRWNRPMPMVPSEEALNSLVASLVRRKISFVNIGLKSDNLAWMDIRYNKTLSLLKKMESKGIDYKIYTESDLCSKEEYQKFCNNKVVFRKLFKSDTEKKQKAPGSPSNLRQDNAIKVVGAKVIKTWLP